MVSVEQLQQQDIISNKNTIIHNVDSRIKLIILILIILFTVSTTNYIAFLSMEIYLLTLIIISKIPLKDALIRIILILPFGFFIAIFQPFLQPGDILYTLPFNIHITLQGLQFMELLMARLTVCITSIILFSFITPLNSIAESFRRLGMPNEFAMIFSLFVRFIFLFFDQLQRIRQAQASRGFTFTNNTPYLWKVKQVGYLFLMMFIRSYEEGEMVYNSMASRGYNSESRLYTSNEKMNKNSWLYLLIPVTIITILEILMYTSII